MDIFVPIVICVILVIMFTICGWCCRRKQEGTVYGLRSPVTVSTQHVQDSHVVAPPYPVGQPQHPVPVTPATAQPVAPGFSHGYHPPPVYPVPGGPGPVQAPYQAAPYPPAPGGVPTYPPPHSNPGPGAPYPPMGNVQPPPYQEAVGYPPVVNEGYSKQSPYNPNY